MPYTTPITWLAGQYPTAAQFNEQISGNISFLANPPACRVRNTVAQNITSGGAPQALTFNTERFDSDNMHSTVSLTERITINTAGIYTITGTMSFSANATGRRHANFTINSASQIAAINVPAVGAGVETTLSLATIWKFAVGEWVEFRAFQDSGVTLQSQAATDVYPEFSAVWLGRG